MPRTSKRSPAAVPFSTVPDAMSISAWRGQAFVVLLDGVELDVEPGRDLADHASPRHGEHARQQEHGDVVEGPTESHDVEHDHGLVVGGVVEDLEAAHLFDALADAGDHQRQPVVGEAGVDAVDPQRHARRRPRRRAGGRSSRPAPRPRGTAGTPARSTPRWSPTAGSSRDRRAPRAGGGRPWRCGRRSRASSANRASASSVAATPSERPRPARSPASRPTLSGFDTHTPDELEVGPGVDAGQRMATDVPGSPQHHAIGHGTLLSPGRPGDARRPRRSRRSCRSRSRRPATTGRRHTPRCPRAVRCASPATSPR